MTRRLPTRGETLLCEAGAHWIATCLAPFGPSPQRVLGGYPWVEGATTYSLEGPYVAFGAASSFDYPIGFGKHLRRLHPGELLGLLCWRLGSVSRLFSGLVRPLP